MARGDYDRAAEIARLQKDWAQNPRWKGVARTYSAEDVVRLRGSVKRENTLARRGADQALGSGQRRGGREIWQGLC